MRPDAFRGLLDRAVRHDGPVLRNIPSIRRSQDLFDDLSSDADDQRAAIALEAATKPASRGADAALDRPFDYGVVDYPFERANFARTRFSDGSFGVFYGALELETTIHETAFHWLDFLHSAAGFAERAVTSERRVYRVDLSAMLLDCRAKLDAFPGLVDPVDYTFTNAVGAYVHANGWDGLITRSARCDGVTTPVFRRERLLASRIHCYLTYKVDPERATLRVERTPGRKLIELDFETAYGRFLR